MICEALSIEIGYGTFTVMLVIVIVQIIVAFLFSCL